MKNKFQVAFDNDATDFIKDMFTKIDQKILSSGDSNSTFNNLDFIKNALFAMEKIVFLMQTTQDLHQKSIAKEVLLAQEFNCCNEDVNGRIQEVLNALNHNNGAELSIQSHAVISDLIQDYMLMKRPGYNESASYTSALLKICYMHLYNKASIEPKGCAQVVKDVTADKPDFLLYVAANYAQRLFQKVYESISTRLDSYLKTRDETLFKGILSDVEIGDTHPDYVNYRAYPYRFMLDLPKLILKKLEDSKFIKQK